MLKQFVIIVSTWMHCIFDRDRQTPHRNGVPTQQALTSSLTSLNQHNQVV
jgi:hypothetical protein